MTLGEKLRNLRLKEKRTLQAQSELCGVKLNTIFRWEHDMSLPREKHLKKIAELHCIPVVWLTQDREIKDHKEYDNITQQLLYIFNNLAYNQKYRILGYIEHIYIDGHNS